MPGWVKVKEGEGPSAWPERPAPCQSHEKVRASLSGSELEELTGLMVSGQGPEVTGAETTATGGRLPER